MARKTNEKVRIMPRLRNLKVGETADFPAKKANGVRTSACLLGLEGLFFTCSVDRTSGKIYARRVRRMEKEG